MAHLLRPCMQFLPHRHREMKTMTSFTRMKYPETAKCIVPPYLEINVVALGLLHGEIRETATRIEDLPGHPTAYKNTNYLPSHLLMLVLNTLDDTNNLSSSICR